MKLWHALLILVLLFIAIDSKALEVHGQFKIGKDLVHEDQLGFANLNLSVNQDIWLFNIKLYGGIRIWFQFTKDIWLSPIRGVYEVGTTLLFMDLFFVNLYHFCSHPVWASYTKANWNEINWQQSLTTLSIGVQW